MDYCLPILVLIIIIYSYFKKVDIYNKFAAGDMEGSLEAQYKLNPVRLSMDGASFPVATKDMANLRGLNVGAPYTPNKLTEGPALEKMRVEMTKAGLL